MINECAFVLEEQVVSEPQQVDLAMVMGAGFPPFYGGPLRYADKKGLTDIVKDLNHWVQKGWLRFQPSSLLQEKACTKRFFYKSV